MPSIVRGLLALGGGGLLSVTLSACYGAPCAGGGDRCYEPPDSGQQPDTDAGSDAGWAFDAGSTDAGSTDAGSTDAGSSDGGSVTCTDPSSDTDSDGYCLELDCDETSADIHAGAADSAGDDIDQNCDGVDGVASADAGA